MLNPIKSTFAFVTPYQDALESSLLFQQCNILKHCLLCMALSAIYKGINLSIVWHLLIVCNFTQILVLRMCVDSISLYIVKTIISFLPFNFYLETIYTLYNDIVKHICPGIFTLIIIRYILQLAKKTVECKVHNVPYQVINAKKIHEQIHIYVFSLNENEE